MSGKRNPRTVQRVIAAAEAVECDTYREAAILGGLVRSLLDTGHLRPKFVHHYVPECMAWFAKDIQRCGERVDSRYPTDAEIRRVASKFLDKYDPGTAERVAA